MYWHEKTLLLIRYLVEISILLLQMPQNFLPKDTNFDSIIKDFD